MLYRSWFWDIAHPPWGVIGGAVRKEGLRDRLDAGDKAVPRAKHGLLAFQKWGLGGENQLKEASNASEGAERQRGICAR